MKKKKDEGETDKEEEGEVERKEERGLEGRKMGIGGNGANE